MINLTDETRSIINGDRISVVKVGATWCGPCKYLKPHFSKWAQNFSVYNGTEIKYYDVDADKCPEFTKAFGVDRYPTTMFFIYGVPVFKQYGVTNTRVFEELLKKSLDIRFERTK